ncbi:MAG: PIN domain-containing protein [Actinomycetota bacterium]
MLLDSTAVIDILRERPGAVARLQQLYQQGDDPYTCAIVADEVSVAVWPRERDAAGALFEGLFEAPLGIAEGRLAGWWRREHRRRGRTLQSSDCLIAAAAVGIGARLATGNLKDFPMKELMVEHWPVNE